MKKLFQNTAFKRGFTSGIGLFIFLNILTFVLSAAKYQKNSEWSAGGYEMGFPFTAHQTYIGYLSGTNILWLGLIADILIALICSFLIGLIFKFVWANIIAFRSR